MERFLEGRTALVTGSVQGIGMAIAQAMASAGARICGLATELEAEAAVEAIRKSGAPDVRFFDADMRKSSAIDAMMADVATWGEADILVNNAGIQNTTSLAEATRQVG